MRLVGGLLFGLIGGLFFGPVGGVLSGLLIWPLPELVGWLIVRLFLHQLTEEREYVLPHEGIRAWLVARLFLGLVVWLIVGRGDRIHPVEVIYRSWKDVPRALISGLLGWLLFGLVGGLVVGLFAGLLSWLVVGLLFGRLTERTHLSPNEGIRRSTKNGLVVGLLVGLVVGLLAGQSAGLGGGLLAGLLAGLAAFIQHVVLRFWLWRTNCLPRKLVAFLNEAAERLLLRKVGGSYIFVHRLLLEYFSNLDEPASIGSTPFKSKTKKDKTDVQR